jgi:integrase
MRGQGRIYARGDSLWISWYAGGDRREAVSTLIGKAPGQTTWDDAVKVLAKRIQQKAEARAKGTILSPGAERMTVDELLEEYTTHRLLSTVKDSAGYRTQMASVRKWWGHLRANRLTTELLEKETQAKLSAGFARGTVKLRIGLLFAALRWAEDRLGRLPKRPRIHTPVTRKGMWTAAELELFVAGVNPWLADVARFGYLTGWRISEVLGMTWDRVDFKRGLVCLHESKNGPRVRPMEPPMLQLMERRKAARALSCASVFHIDGRSVRSDQFYYAWSEGLKKAGLGRKFFHDFRRGAYDRLLLGGVDLATAMDMIGHEAIGSAKRYIHPSMERMRAALTRVEQYGSGTGPATVTPISG